MWHKPCRTFHPWCPCIKTRCLFMLFMYLRYVYPWSWYLMKMLAILVHAMFNRAVYVCNDKIMLGFYSCSDNMYQSYILSQSGYSTIRFCQFIRLDGHIESSLSKGTWDVFAANLNLETRVQRMGYWPFVKGIHQSPVNGGFPSQKAKTGWRHQMKTLSVLLALYARNSPVTAEFPAQRPVTRNFDVFFDLRLNKKLNKQSWGWWFETPSRSLWRHCDKKANNRTPLLTHLCNASWTHNSFWNAFKFIKLKCCLEGV